MSDPIIKPHNPDAERRVIGCLLSKNESLQEVIADYPVGDALFYDDKHGAIFAAMRDENSNNPVVVKNLLEKRGIEFGGVPYLMGLMNEVASGGIDETRMYADMLVRDWVRRQLIEASFTIERDGYESENAAEALENAEKRIMEIGRSLQSGADPLVRSLVLEANSELEQAYDQKGKIRGLSIGFPDLDWMTHGLKAGEVIVIAARPGGGKTSLAMNIVENVAVEQKYPVGVFSLEMSGKELVFRMLCSRAKVDSSRAQSGQLGDRDFPRLTGASGKIANAPIHICEKGGLTISQLGARARRMHQRHKLKLLVIDYLQLMQSRSKGNRNEQITEISNGVKALAKDLAIPVIVLSQLNRDVDKSEREPRMSDLRDSGSIEQDADLIVLLSPKPKKDGTDYIEVDALIPKHRNGPVGKVELLFHPQFTRFESKSRVVDVPTEAPKHWNGE